MMVTMMVNCPISLTAPPVQLFYPIFGHFLDDIADDIADVLPEILWAAACFMVSMS